MHALRCKPSVFFSIYVKLKWRQIGVRWYPSALMGPFSAPTATKLLADGGHAPIRLPQCFGIAKGTGGRTRGEVSFPIIFWRFQVVPSYRLNPFDAIGRFIWLVALQSFVPIFSCYDAGMGWHLTMQCEWCGRVLGTTGCSTRSSGKNSKPQARLRAFGCPSLCGTGPYPWKVRGCCRSGSNWRCWRWCWRRDWDQSLWLWWGSPRVSSYDDLRSTGCQYKFCSRWALGTRTHKILDYHAIFWAFQWCLVSFMASVAKEPQTFGFVRK